MLEGNTETKEGLSKISFWDLLYQFANFLFYFFFLNSKRAVLAAFLPAMNSTCLLRDVNFEKISNSFEDNISTLRDPSLLKKTNADTRSALFVS